jgi:antitoxin CptB
MSSDEDRLKKLRFRAWRRGFREADLILGPFADRHVQSFTPAQLDALEILLDQPDHDLYGWITGRVPTPHEFDNELMNLIKVFHLEAHKAFGLDHGG